MISGRSGSIAADRGDAATDEVRVKLATEPTQPEGGWLVEEVEAEVVGRDTAEVLRERRPDGDEPVLRLAVVPEVVDLQLLARDAVAGRAVQVE